MDIEFEQKPTTIIALMLDVDNVVLQWMTAQCPEGTGLAEHLTMMISQAVTELYEESAYAEQQ